MNNYLEVSFSLENIPLDYKLLEWYLIINHELYENHIIDIITFNDIENALLTKLNQLKSR